MPTSADFIPLASDPRGGDAGYAYFPPDDNGNGIAFRNFSHDEFGDNSVWRYDPRADGWTQVLPHTPWPGGVDVTGLSFLGNSDDGPMIVVKGELWALMGERGTSPIGNYQGILPLASPAWVVEDTWGALRRVVGGTPHEHEDGAMGFVPALNMVYILGGWEVNPSDTLELIDVSGTPPYPRTTYFDEEGNPPYPGAEQYRYISHNHWVRGKAIRVYGPHLDRDTGETVGDNELAEIDLSVSPPVRTVVSVNNLPNAVIGEALISYAVPGTDLEVVTDGKHMNVHDAVSDVWVDIPINQAADPNRESPTNAGSGLAGYYSVDTGQYILLGKTSQMYGIRLNFPAPPSARIVYKALEPCRVMDTRTASQVSGVHGPVVGGALYNLPGFVAAGSNWSLFGGSATDCGLNDSVGTNIQAIAMVVTILNPSADAFLGVSDVNDLTATLSTVALNYTGGQGLSTMYVEPQTTSNTIYFALSNQVSAHLIFDVVGYFVTSDATALQCTAQASPPTTVSASGGSGTATAPSCIAGYALASGSCDSDSVAMKLVSDKAAGQGWMCSAINSGGADAHLTAAANCCRVAGM